MVYPKLSLAQKRAEENKVRPSIANDFSNLEDIVIQHRLNKILQRRAIFNDILLACTSSHTSFSSLF